jgi:hypothetical protein
MEMHNDSHENRGLSHQLNQSMPQQVAGLLQLKISDMVPSRVSSFFDLIAANTVNLCYRML